MPAFFQMTFSPVSGSHLSMRPFSRETPFCSGPRHWDQSPANAGAATERAAKKIEASFSFMGFPGALVVWFEPRRHEEHEAGVMEPDRRCAKRKFLMSKARHTAGTIVQTIDHPDCSRKRRNFNGHRFVFFVSSWFNSSS